MVVTGNTAKQIPIRAPTLVEATECMEDARTIHVRVPHAPLDPAIASRYPFTTFLCRSLDDDIHNFSRQIRTDGACHATLDTVVVP